MEISISCSDKERKQVALLLKGWSKKLLQTTDHRVSGLDIIPGFNWSHTVTPNRISVVLKNDRKG
jgi:hypothetical protein